MPYNLDDPIAQSIESWNSDYETAGSNVGLKYLCGTISVASALFRGADGRVVKTPAFGLEGLKIDPQRQPLVQLSYIVVAIPSFRCILVKGICNL